MSDDRTQGWLSAAEAAEQLGVKVETVYAYVSRGLLARRRDDARGFSALEVGRLAARGRRKTGARAEAAPLEVLSELTELGPDRLLYRGRDAIALAAELRFERLAEWLWASGESSAAFIAPRAAVALSAAVSGGLPEAALPLDRLRVIAAVLGSSDALRFDVSAGAAIATARTLIAGMVESLPRALQRADKRAQVESLSQRLWTRLSPLAPEPARVLALDFALGLCADHALSPSTLAARIAASQRADPYSVVQTGLGALGGSLHGPASLAAEELLREVEAGADPSVVIGQRLRRGERIAGFGHAQHSGGDPRAKALLERVQTTFANQRGAHAARDVERVMRERGLPAPNIDFALASLARAGRMIHGASEAIMAIARSAGFVAHALEEYRRPTAFPWRALYVGAHE